MKDLAYYATFYNLLSELYAVTYYLESDSNFSREDAVKELLKVIQTLEEER